MITSVFERTRVFSRIALAVVATVVFFVGGLLMSQPSSAAPGINEQINFQGRLFTSEGATVPDGVYNLQFKLYQDGSGDTAGNPGGTLEWTENHLRSASNGVTIKNGYLSVQLGSVTPFGSSVDWNQDTLWLSINIGNTTVCTITTDFDTDCGGDGEMLPMKRLSSTPFSLNSARLGGLTASEFIQSTTTPQSANIAVQSADAGDVAAFIQGAAGQTADIFQVAADGVATPLLAVSNAGSVTITPTSDAAPALSVNSTTGSIFTASADAIALNQDTTIAAGKSLTITGGNTASRPASPTEGMVYYDTDTDRLLTYANGKWQADRGDAILVAANDSSQTDKDAADYVADGTDDQVEINAALAAADPASGSRKTGKVYLFAGTYVTNQTNDGDASIKVPNNTTLAGAGRGTLIELGDIDADDNLIVNADTTAGTGVVVRDMRLDGRRDINNPGTNYGIYMQGLGNGTGSSSRKGGTFTGLWIERFNNTGLRFNGVANSFVNDIHANYNSLTGIYIGNTTNTTVTNSIADGNSSLNGISVTNSSTYNVFSNNILRNNGTSGISFTNNSHDNIVTGNLIEDNDIRALNINTSDRNIVSNNRVTNSGGIETNEGISLDNADDNQITNNTITDDQCNTTCYAINISNATSDRTYLEGNRYYDTDADDDASINDVGTNTIYVGQQTGTVANGTNGVSDFRFRGSNDSATAFAIQNAAGDSILNLDTTNMTAVINNGTGTANILDVQDAGTSVLAVADGGAVTLQNQVNSDSAFAVNNNLGNTLFSVDTDNSRVVIGPVSSGSTASARLYFGDIANVNNLWIGEQGGTDSDILQIQGKNGVQISTGTGADTALSIDNEGQATFENNDGDNEKAEVVVRQNNGGDAAMQFSTDKGDWAVGVDESDRNVFKITSGNAAAPVSTFGNTNPGTLNDSDNNNVINAGRYTATVSGDVISLSVYIGCSIDDAPNNKFRMALYSDNGSGTAPQTLLTESGESTLEPGWNSIPVPAAAVTTGNDYWIAYNTNGTAINLNCYRSVSSGGVNVWNDPQPFGAMPSTWPGNTNGNTVNPGFYANVRTSSTYDLFNTALFEMTSSGAATFRNLQDTPDAFRLQNAAGTRIMTGDTENNRLQVGSAIDDDIAIFFMLDNYNQAADPTGTDGAMYYNTNTNKFRCYQDGAWLDCIGATAASYALDDLSNLASTNINAALNATANDLTLQTTTSGDVVLNAADSILLQSATTISGGVVSINESSNFAVNIGSGTNTAAVTIGNSGNVTTLGSDTINVGSSTADTTIQKSGQTAANTAGNSLTIQGATGNGTGAGGVVTIQGGTGGATNGNGGNLVLSGGNGTGSGVDGLVVLSTPTFSTTTNDANCYTGGALVASSCTIALTSVNSSAAIIVGLSSADQTVTLPDPTILTAGRVAYITAASNSQDFALIVNGGGQGNEIAMRANTTATMIWSGSDWTAAGASSSTTLQAAYNNTLSSAGGAEIILNNTPTSNGLTVRNSASNAIIGGIFEAQTSIGSNLFSVNNNATEFATNGGAETLGATASTFPANTWDTTTGGTVDRWTTLGDNIATGAASVRVQATGANHGARNRISTPLTSGLTYSVSFAVRGATNFNTLDVRYSPDGTTSGTTQCTTTEVVTSGIWTRINCTFIASGAITANNSMLIRQTDGTTRTFYIDNLSITINASATYAADGSVDNAGAFGTNWTAYGAGSVAARDTAVIYDSSASARVNTTNDADRGIRNNLAIVPATNTQYLVSFYARSGGGAINDLTVRYSRDGGTSFAPCVDYNTQAIGTSSWTKITCLFTTDSTTASNADLIITQAAAPGGTRSIYVDALSITLNTNNANNVQIGGANKGGPTTLLTLDRSDSPPIAANNEAYLGSMYYDTTTGRIQCYEADGWGACGSAPDNIVNLSPEYAGAVLNGSGVGTMTADLCANESGVLQVNNTLCDTGESKNFYRWTSPQATQQTYSIYVSYQLPTTFKAFSSDDTVQLTARVDDTTNAAVTYEMFRSEGGALTQCGSGETAVTTAANTWQTVGINGNEATGCGFNSNSGGAYVLFKINVKANSNANAFVSTLSFVTTGK